MGVYKTWHCQSWPSYTMVDEYSKHIYLPTNISVWKKGLTVQKSLMNVIKYRGKWLHWKKEGEEEQDNPPDVQDNNVLT
jgi:hypothetical protein